MKSYSEHSVINHYYGSDTPFSAQVELNTTCNLNCSHCYLSDHSNPGLTTKELKKVFDDIAELGVIRLGLTGGEVFMRSDIFELLEYAKKKGFRVYFNTNLTLLDKSRVKKLKQLQIHNIKISLYGHNEEEHDKITRVKGSFNKIINNIKLLKSEGVKFSISLILFKQTFEKIEQIFEMADKLGVKDNIEIGWRMIQKRGNKEDKMDTKLLQLSYDQVKKLGRYMRENISIEKRDEIIEEVKHEGGVCGAGKVNMEITAEGYVNPCVFLFQNKESRDLRKRSIKDIWENDPFFKKIRAIKMQELKKCSKCEYVKMCDVCFGYFFQETGSYIRPGEEYCRLSKALLLREK